MLKFEAIEDNGGGLYLAIFEGNKVRYLFGKLQYLKGELSNCIAELKKGDDPLCWLKNGEDPNCWENAIENPQESYEILTSNEYGYKIVEDNDGIYYDRMGGSAKKEYGVI